MNDESGTTTREFITIPGPLQLQKELERVRAFIEKHEKELYRHDNGYPNATYARGIIEFNKKMKAEVDEVLQRDG